MYHYIELMDRLLKLRIQLNFIRDYIFTCSESAIIELQKSLYGREYMYESIHFYSIADLILIQSGGLEEMLKRVVLIHRNHCSNCSRCKAKGFYCEYCKSEEIIYSFDVDKTHQCSYCGTLSHLNCYQTATSSCNKCDRIKERKKKLEIENSTESSSEIVEEIEEVLKCQMKK